VHQAGVGLTPSGLYTNEIVYALASEVVWSSGEDETLSGWISGFVRRRYGSVSPDLLAAWGALSESVYGRTDFSPRVLTQRPSLTYSLPAINVSQADAVFDVSSICYDDIIAVSYEVC
jgi:Alpha-N-acetylglucosaminidase (NAGLU) C-terminal domain